MTKRRLRTVLGISVAVVCSLAFAPAAMADFVVNDLGDGDDAQFGVTTLDGTCDTVAGAPVVCTLRAAIEEADNTPAADTITFSVTGQHNTGSELPISAPLSIDGNGSGAAGTVIDAGDAHRIFSVGIGASPLVTFKDLRLQNGHVTLSGPTNGGPAIQSDASLSLVNTTVTSNDVTGTGPGTGAIFGPSIGGTVSLVDSTVSGNTISSTGNNSGAGIDVSEGPANLTLTRTTVSGNAITAGTAAGGGGIATNADLSITDSTISGNSITSGTFGTSGGGISATGTGTKTIINSTVSGNTAGDGLSGGGGGASIDGDAAITNSTLAGNAASFSGADLMTFSGAVTLKNTILGSAGACTPSGGTFVSAAPGNNIDESTSCGLGTTQGNRENTNPLLGALALNSPGTTKTHALLPGSPAIDTATADCGGLSADQRGVSRPQPTGGACDVGAFELAQASPPPSGGGSTTPPAPTSPAPATTKKKCKKKKKKHSRAAVAAKKCKKRK
jgi:hypothetical protein